MGFTFVSFADAVTASLVASVAYVYAMVSCVVVLLCTRGHVVLGPQAPSILLSTTAYNGTVSHVAQPPVALCTTALAPSTAFLYGCSCLVSTPMACFVVCG